MPTTFPEQRLETIRVLGRTMQCPLAHDIWTYRDAGVLPADALARSGSLRSSPLFAFYSPRSTVAYRQLRRQEKEKGKTRPA